MGRSVKWAFGAAFAGGLAATGFAAAGLDRGATVTLGLAFCVLVAAVALGMRLLVTESRRARGDVLTVVRDGFKRTRAEVVQLREADKQGKRERERVASLLSKTASQQADVVGKVAAVERRVNEIRKVTNRLESIIDRVPSEAANLVRFQNELVEDLVSMPALGGWAATTPTVIYLVENVLSDARPPVVLECGSGTSTVWIAAALRRRGEGRVVALEHDLAYAAQTRRDLTRRGLGDIASIVDAPLVECTTAAGAAPWYDLTDLGDLDGITLLFVDGPPASTAPHARRPAFELLVDRLADDAIVVLDDTHRDVEREIVEEWTTQAVNGRRLEVVAQVGRSTALRLVSV